MGIILGIVGFVVVMYGIATAWGAVDAARLYRAALKDPEQVNQMGVESARKGDFGPALLRFRHAAQLGHAGAACNLGFMFAQGKGVPPNHAEAFKAFNFAAERGLAEGKLHVGLCYANGTGVEKDLSKAYHYFKAAAEQSCEPARECAEEFELSAAAYDPWDPEANSEEEREQRMAVIHHCRRRNTIEGFEEAANEYADVDSMIALSVCYLSAKLVPVSRTKAHVWINQARKMGSRKAKAVSELMRLDVEIDLGAIKDALLLCESAEQSAAARHQLGKKFLTGDGVAVDLEESAYFFFMSRDLPESRAELERIPRDEWPEQFRAVDLEVVA